MDLAGFEVSEDETLGLPSSGLEIASRNILMPHGAKHPICRNVFRSLSLNKDKCLIGSEAQDPYSSPGLILDHAHQK